MWSSSNWSQYFLAQYSSSRGSSFVRSTDSSSPRLNNFIALDRSSKSVTFLIRGLKRFHDVRLAWHGEVPQKRQRERPVETDNVCYNTSLNVQRWQQVIYRKVLHAEWILPLLYYEQKEPPGKWLWISILLTSSPCLEHGNHGCPSPLGAVSNRRCIHIRVSQHQRYNPTQKGTEYLISDSLKQIKLR